MKTLLLAASLLFGASAAHAVRAMPELVPMSEAELEQARGGFLLPNGMSINLGITSQTRIDGRMVLMTVYNLDEGPPRLRVLGSREAAAPGLSELTLVPDGAGVATADGLILITGPANQMRVMFRGEAIDVTHLAGSAIGTLVANSANDRSIDVLTSVDLRIGGVAPELLGSSMSRVDTAVLDATTRMTR